MKKILIHSFGAFDNNIFDTRVRDNYNRPYIYLKEKLFDLGFDLTTSDHHNLDDVEYVFFHDYNSVTPYSGFKGLLKLILSVFINKYKIRNLYKEIKKTNIKSILFLWEAASVMPRNWDPKLHDRFDKIMTWNDDYVDNFKFFKIYWPQTDLFPVVRNIPFNEKKLIVNISMNKSSNHYLELYSERLNTISYFDEFYPDDFDLFGYGWNDNNLFKKSKNQTSFKSYKGTIKNKWDVLPGYKFAICYENIKDTSGWVTEKIFDCFRCNCIPIYWGAKNISDFVSPETFIDRRNFSSNSELANFIVNMTEMEHSNYIKNINEYLKSDLFCKFLPEFYFQTIFKQLN